MRPHLEARRRHKPVTGYGDVSHARKLALCRSSSPAADTVPTLPRPWILVSYVRYPEAKPRWRPCSSRRSKAALRSATRSAPFRPQGSGSRSRSIAQTHAYFRPW